MFSGSLEPGEGFQMSRPQEMQTRKSPLTALWQRPGRQGFCAEARVAGAEMAGARMTGVGMAGLLGRGSVMSLRRAGPQPES